MTQMDGCLLLTSHRRSWVREQQGHGREVNRGFKFGGAEVVDGTVGPPCGISGLSPSGVEGEITLCDQHTRSEKSICARSGIDQKSTDGGEMVSVHPDFMLQIVPPFWLGTINSGEREKGFKNRHKKLFFSESNRQFRLLSLLSSSPSSSSSLWPLL